MNEEKLRGQYLWKLLLSDSLSENDAANLGAIASLASDHSSEGKLFSQIIHELLRVEPKNYGRVRDYFFELNDNAERRPIKTPREFASQLRKSKYDAGK